MYIYISVLEIVIAYINYCVKNKKKITLPHKVTFGFTAFQLGVQKTLFINRKSLLNNNNNCNRVHNKRIQLQKASAPTPTKVLCRKLLIWEYIIYVNTNTYTHAHTHIWKHAQHTAEENEFKSAFLPLL